MEHRERHRCVLALAPVDTAVRAARDTVRTAMDGWDREDLNGDLELITSELVTNAIRHGTAVTLVLSLPDDKTAMVEVWDDDPRGPVVPPAPDLQAEGGRGLMLVGALACSWGWRSTSEGKVIWAQTATL